MHLGPWCRSGYSIYEMLLGLANKKVSITGIMQILNLDEICILRKYSWKSHRIYPASIDSFISYTHHKHKSLQSSRVRLFSANTTKDANAW